MGKDTFKGVVKGGASPGDLNGKMTACARNSSEGRVGGSWCVQPSNQSIVQLSGNNKKGGKGKGCS